MAEGQDQNYFWNALFMATGIVMKSSMKNLLTFLSWDNPLSFSKMTETDIESAEKFPREKMVKFLDLTADLKEYYGIYHKNPKDFSFMEGEKALLRELIQLVKDKPINFWAPCNINDTPQVSNVSSSEKPGSAQIDTERERAKLKRTNGTTITQFKKKNQSNLIQDHANSLNGTTSIDIQGLYVD